MNNKMYDSAIIYDCNFEYSTKIVNDLIFHDGTSFCPGLFDHEEYFGSLSHTIDDLEQLLGTTHTYASLPWEVVNEES